MIGNGRTTASESARREEKTFSRAILLALVMVVFIYLTGQYGLPQTQQAADDVTLRIGGFFVVITVHGILYLLGPRIRTRSYVVLPYFLVQTVLVFLMGLFTLSGPIILLLYIAIIAEAVAVLGGTSRVFGVAAWAVLLFSINVGFASGVTGAVNSLLMLTTLGLVIYLVIHVRGAVAVRRINVLAKDLEASHRELADYAAQVEGLTRASERERMARELHDTLAQGLVGLTLQLEAADSHLAKGHPGRAQEIVHQAISRGRETLAEARRAIYDLRTQNPSDDDLERAVREEVNRFSAATGVDCRPAIALEGDISREIVEQVLRCVREGLTNVLRHAHARAVELSLTHSPRAIEILIRDDGVGFDPDTIPAGHYGLLGLRERTRAAGGSMAVESAAGEGTTLHISFPAEFAEEIA